MHMMITYLLCILLVPIVVAEECAICLSDDDPVTPFNSAMLIDLCHNDCIHGSEMHKSCALEWYHRKKPDATCPVCRKPFKNIEERVVISSEALTVTTTLIQPSPIPQHLQLDQLHPPPPLQQGLIPTTSIVPSAPLRQTIDEPQSYDQESSDSSSIWEQLPSEAPESSSDWQQPPEPAPSNWEEPSTSVTNLPAGYYYICVCGRRYQRCLSAKEGSNEIYASHKTEEVIDSVFHLEYLDLHGTFALSYYDPDDPQMKRISTDLKLNLNGEVGFFQAFSVPVRGINSNAFYIRSLSQRWWKANKRHVRFRTDKIIQPNGNQYDRTVFRFYPDIDGPPSLQL